MAGLKRPWVPALVDRVDGHGLASKLSTVAVAAGGGSGGGSSSGGGEAMSQADLGLFVRFLHTASPYVAGHRGRTFVISIPGEVVANEQQLYPLLQGGLTAL